MRGFQIAYRFPGRHHLRPLRPAPVRPADFVEAWNALGVRLQAGFVVGESLVGFQGALGFRACSKGFSGCVRGALSGFLS